MSTEDFRDEPDAGVEPLAGEDEAAGVEPLEPEEDEDATLEEFEEEWEEHWQEQQGGEG